MGKNYFFEFTGRIFIKADEQDHKEELVNGIKLENYLTDEDIYQIDENYIPVNLKKRLEQLGTKFHPLDAPDEYEAFKMREVRYGKIFNDFLNEKFGKKELMEKMELADKMEIDPGDLIHSVSMVDLKSKKRKIARLVNVD